MSHKTQDAPIIMIAEGPFRGSRGPVVGIDQDRGTVQVRVPVPGVSLFARRGRTVEIDVRHVKRLDQSK